MALPSDVEIANMALSHIGSRAKIESLTEESTEAKEVNRWYDFARQRVIQLYNWSFATKRVTLTTHADDAPEGVWLYRYQYPSDCLSIQLIVNQFSKTDDPLPYAIEMSDDGTTKTIVTDVDDAILKYTFDQADESLYTPAFSLAFSYSLANSIAFTLTGKLSLKEAMLRDMFRTAVDATSMDANEDQPQAPREAEWIRGRA